MHKRVLVIRMGLVHTAKSLQPGPNISTETEATLDVSDKRNRRHGAL